LPSAPIARAESTRTPPVATLQENRIPQTIETSPPTQPSTTLLPPATSTERNSEEIAQSGVAQREQTALPQTVQPSRRLTVLPQTQPQSTPSLTENAPSETGRNEVQSSQQLPQAEITPPLPVPAKVPSTTDNQLPKIEAPPAELLNPDLVAELPPAERALMLKPLDTQTLQKITNVLQANAGTNQSSQPGQSNTVSAR
jgi:hypothetical protein